MRRIRLGDACEKIGSGATPRGGADVYVSQGIALIRSQNIYNDGFREEGLAFIDDAHAEELRNVEVRTGDVLLNITGDSVARICQVPDDILPARVNQHVAIIRPHEDILHARYLRYFLVSPTMQAHMMALAGAGATRNALTKGMIENFDIPVPSPSEQHAIAEILGALDDKIDLNRRMNETLEALARAIFKSWFVDFEPVHAKMDGRWRRGQSLPGLPADLYELFPGSLDDSPLGRIPATWEAGTLSEVLSELETGGRPNGGVRNIRNGVPSIGAESIVGLGTFDFSKTRFVPTEYFKGMHKGHVRNRDVLVYKDGGRPGEYEPHLSMFGDGFPFEECCINEHVYRLQAHKKFSQCFLYFWLGSDTAKDEMRVKGTGVAVPGLNSTALRSVAVLIPDVRALDAFDSVVEPLVAAVLSTAKQSQTLAVAREALLPKLISGELRVKDSGKLLTEKRLRHPV